MMFAQANPPSSSVTTTDFWAAPTPWIVIAIVILAIVVIAFAVRQRRSQALKDRFGAEYDRAVSAAGSRQDAEAELAERERRVRSYHLKSLTPGARDRYIDEWRDVQAQFVDAPADAIAAADHLIQDVMHDRGYPVRAFDQRAADLSVDHADVVTRYRTANLIAMKADRGEATTEDLRRAMTQYRDLFDNLIGAEAAAAARAGA
jgi:FtsZ-interacting cell division protein ZipA